MRDEIQGLRALAISSVLFFHAWQSTFPAGFLGVDVFFVISGYLMASIMSKSAISVESIKKFYLRRLNRILPLYLTVVIFILISTLLLTSPIEFESIVDDAFSSILLISNWNMIKLPSYFDILHKFNLFTHFWSLGVELQFYLVVPFIFLVFQTIQRLFGRNTINYLLLTTGIVISFGAQWILSWSNQNQSFYATYNRLWQFFVGFLSFFWYDKQTLRSSEDSRSNCSSDSTNSVLSKFNAIFVKVLSNITLLLLIITLLFKVFPSNHLNRLSATLLTGLLLSQRLYNPILLLKPLLFLGDISYSVYLIHWPILAIHRYWSPEKYDYKNPEAPFADGLGLILISFFAGYVLEVTFEKIRTAVSSWSTLFMVLIGQYLFIGVLLMMLWSSCGPEYVSDMKKEERAIDGQRTFELRKIVHHLYEDGTNSTDFLKADQLQLNADLYRYSHEWLGCDERNAELPTAFQYKGGYDFSSTCHDKGGGSKQMVVIGNSHARALADGLKYHFHDVYEDMYIISRDLCTPFMSHTMPEWREECMKFEGVYEPLLEGWNKKIDIIIVGLQYLPDLDPLILDWDNDEYLKAMEEFFGKMSQIAQEVVFVPMVHFNWKVEPFEQILQQILYFDKDLKHFQMLEKTMKDYLSHVQRRLDRLKCHKCLKVDYQSTWCSDGLCSALDNKNISYFQDSTHVTPYGSLKYGELLRSLYNQYLIYDMV